MPPLRIVVPPLTLFSGSASAYMTIGVRNRGEYIVLGLPKDVGIGYIREWYELKRHGEVTLKWVSRVRVPFRLYYNKAKPFKEGVVPICIWEWKWAFKVLFFFFFFLFGHG